MKFVMLLAALLALGTAALGAQSPDLSALEKALGITLTDAQRLVILDNLRKDRPWIPSDSTIQLKAVQVELAVVDNLAKPFVNDPAILGTWSVVDYVNTLEDFTPGWRAFDGQLYWNKVEFDKSFDVGVYLNGSKQSRVKWTKGFVLFNWSDVKVASTYVIKSIGGKDHLFVEWKASGDYSMRGQKPGWYVFTK